MPVRKMMLVGVLTALAAPGLAQDASTLPYQDPAPAKTPNVDLKPGANSFAESQAKKLLETKGYSRISALVNDRDGIWRGSAQKGDRKVDVSVDFQGHVAEK